MGRSLPLWPFLQEVDIRAGKLAENLPLLSVSQTRGVVRFSEIFDKEPRAENLSNYKLVEPEDLVINRMSADKGALGIASERGIASPDYMVLRSKGEVSPKYIAYLLKSDFGLSEIKKILRGIGTGDTNTVRTPRISRHELLHIKWPNIPVLEDQKRIADELDRELTKINELIADVQRLESLEQERIVAERDWAFEQSETSVPLRYIAKFITSGSRGWGDYVGSVGSPFMRITNLRRDSVEPDLSNLLYVDTARLPNDEGKRSQLQVGDILISITADLGSVAVVDQSIVGGYVSQHLALVRIDMEKYDPYAIAEAILSSNVKHQINQKSYGGTKVQLSLEDIKELYIPIKNEQAIPKPYQSKKGIIELLTEKKFSTLHKNILGTVSKGISQ